MYFKEKEHYTRVAGVSYDGRQKYIEKMDEKTPLKLELEPDNPYDKNAVKVLAEIEDKWEHIGYLHKEYASWTVKKIKEGKEIGINLTSIEKEEYGWNHYKEEPDVSFLRVHILIYII